LSLLVGEPLPAEVAAGEHAIEAQTFKLELPVGVPSLLLARRPDIRAAEHALKAANADIGAARAAFFPSISLTGSYGNASDDLDSLFESGHTSWSFTPQIRLPIFSGGANVAGLSLAKARKRIEVARYEQSIQIAFREVADALVARATYTEQIRAQEALTRASEGSYKLADVRYRGGVDSYLSSLIAQRDVYSARRALIETRLARASNLIRLYAALGGGWPVVVAVVAVVDSFICRSARCLSSFTARTDRSWRSLPSTLYHNGAPRLSNSAVSSIPRTLVRLKPCNHASPELGNRTRPAAESMARCFCAMSVSALVKAVGAAAAFSWTGASAPAFSA
jgi:hypothetical protein